MAPKKKVFIYGNEMLEIDNLAIVIGKLLKNDKELDKDFEFIIGIEPDVILNTGSQSIIILDVAKGINDIVLITDLNSLKTNTVFSSHDLNLGFYLKLLENFNNFHKSEIKIIAIPNNWHNRTKNVYERVKNILNKFI